MTEPTVLDEVAAAVLGPARWTRTETAERSGAALDDATRLWRAMGFPEVGEGERVFTDRDVEALRTAFALVAGGVLDLDGLVALTRAMAQALSRLALSHAEIAARWLLTRPDLAGELRGAAEPLVAEVEALLDFVWRRHLVAAAEGFLAAPDDGAEVAVAVGFADLVGFTELSRTLSPDELGSAVEAFESLATEVVTERAGRVVKTLGDEVLFQVGAVDVAAETALGLVEAMAARLGREVRVGLAYGPVLSRLGDVFGPTVNIASRLTGLARPGTVLVDRDAAAALRDDVRYDVAPIRRQAVRGYAHLAPYRLRRKETP